MHYVHWFTQSGFQVYLIRSNNNNKLPKEATNEETMQDCYPTTEHTRYYTVRQLYDGLNNNSICPLRNPPTGVIIIDGNNVVPRQLSYVVSCLRHLGRFFIDKVTNPVTQTVLSDCLRELADVRMGPVCDFKIEFHSTESGLNEFCTAAESAGTRLRSIYMKSNNAEVNLESLHRLCRDNIHLTILDLHNVILTANGKENLRKIIFEHDILAVHLTNVVLSHEVGDSLAPDTIDFIHDISRRMKWGGGRTIT